MPRAIVKRVRKPITRFAPSRVKPVIERTIMQRGGGGGGQARLDTAASPTICKALELFVYDLLRCVGEIDGNNTVAGSWVHCSKLLQLAEEVPRFHFLQGVLRGNAGEQVRSPVEPIGSPAPLAVDSGNERSGGIGSDSTDESILDIIQLLNSTSGVNFDACPNVISYNNNDSTSLGRSSLVDSSKLEIRRIAEVLSKECEGDDHLPAAADLSPGGGSNPLDDIEALIVKDWEQLGSESPSWARLPDDNAFGDGMQFLPIRDSPLYLPDAVHHADNNSFSQHSNGGSRPFQPNGSNWTWAQENDPAFSFDMPNPL